MRDFKDYIESEGKYDYFQRKDMDIFRHEYPEHVIKKARCIDKILANPKIALQIINDYKLDKEKIREIMRITKLNEKHINELLKRSQL